MLKAITPECVDGRNVAILPTQPDAEEPQIVLSRKKSPTSRESLMICNSHLNWLLKTRARIFLCFVYMRAEMALLLPQVFNFFLMVLRGF